MARIFHQNMRVFGGGAPGRNNAYTAAFTNIQRVTGQDYIVAGFTEVTNPNVRLRSKLRDLATTLDEGLNQLVVIAVGTTVFGGPEYVGITWDPQYVDVRSAGAFLWNSTTKSWELRDTAAEAIEDDRILLPTDLSLGADRRGPAYIAAIAFGMHFVFAFMHNMYSQGEKSGAFSALPDMVRNLRAHLGRMRDKGFAQAEVIIGGDFNLAPRRPKRRRNETILLDIRATEIRRGGYVNTTLANPYDFWLVSNTTIPENYAEVHTATRVPLASDHAAIALRR